jgi:hypothetical protein
MPKRKSDKHAAAAGAQPTEGPEVTQIAPGADPEGAPAPLKPPATTRHRKATTRREALRDVLSKEGGASIAELCDTFGWQAHSARAAISGLKKDGATVERLLPREGKTGSRYRIAREVSA